MLAVGSSLAISTVSSRSSCLLLLRARVAPFALGDLAPFASEVVALDATTLDKVARLKMFPFAVQAPWGISPALLPEIPLPTKIRTEFQEPIKVSRDPAKANDDAYLEKKYEEVQSSIQRGMDILARHRRLPLFG